jgi:hypothetical protein
MILSNFKEPHNTGLIAVEEGHHLENQNFFMIMWLDIIVNEEQAFGYKQNAS